MDIFNNNRKLEAAIFEGMDYALYSRSDIQDTFMPFMMLFKDGQRKLIRIAYEGDPNVGFEETLQNQEEIYDQIVMCFEGRVPFENTKHDAIIVKGFDTSQENGLLFIQRFRGIESGKPFQKLGRIAFASKTEKSPVKTIARDTNKIIEEPYISGIVIRDKETGLSNRNIIAGHENGSFLSNHLYQAIINALNKEEPDFSGKFKFSFVPGTLIDSGFNRFIIEQLVEEIYKDTIINSWETKFQRKLDISYKFDGSEEIKILRSKEQLNSKSITSVKKTIITNKELKPWWKFW